MEKTVFIQDLLKAALDAGIEAAEVFTSYRDSFNAMCNNGEVTSYQVATKEGLSLRGLYNGKMGYAFTEAYDDEAIDMLVNGVIDTRSLPISAEMKEVCTRQGWDPLRLALCGGEDYELLFTISEAGEKALDIEHHVIGRICAGSELIWQDAEEDYIGYRHF